MNPTAFTLFGLDVRWYGLLIGSGMLIGMLLASYTCKVKKLSYDIIMDLTIIAIPTALIGARLWYVIFEFTSYYRYHLNEIFNIRQGGLAIQGGVLFALVAAYIAARVKKVNFFRYADAAAPSIILAQAIGRWGNFFNQEAHGGVVSYDFIKHFPSFIQKGMFIDGAYYHPTFLYESLWNLLVFIILMIILHKSSKVGMVLFSYIGLYSIGRFFIEGMRTDSLMIGFLRTAQIISIIGVIIWLVYLYLTYIKKKSILSEQP